MTPPALRAGASGDGGAAGSGGRMEELPALVGCLETPAGHSVMEGRLAKPAGYSETAVVEGCLAKLAGYSETPMAEDAWRGRRVV